MAADGRRIVLIGCGGHGKSVGDSIEAGGAYRIAGYTEGQKDPASYYIYLGTDDVLEELRCQGIAHAAVGVGYMGRGDVRDRLYRMAKDLGYELPVIRDPSAIVSGNAAVGEGSFLAKGAIVNADAAVGKMCIVNTGAVLEHDVRAGDFSHVAGGAVLCGGVQVGSHALIGANATVIQQVRIGERAIVGAGSVVLADVPDGKTVCGVWKGGGRI